MDERITLEPATENGKHFVIATIYLAKISPQKCDGPTRREAVEEAVSMLIDLCDCLYDESEALRARIATLEAQLEQAREALDDLVDASIEVSEVPQFVDQATVRPGEEPGDEAVVQMSCGLVRLRRLGVAIANAESALQALREGGENAE